MAYFSSLLELSDWPKLADFTDPNALYFSWYTMDLMLAEHLGYDIVKKRIVVASTGALVEDERIAAAAIAFNDFEIAKEGAGIIRKDWSGQTSLGFQDVAEPSFRLWIDCASLRAKGIDDVRARVHADVTVGCQ